MLCHTLVCSNCSVEMHNLRATTGCPSFLAPSQYLCARSRPRPQDARCCSQSSATRRGADPRAYGTPRRRLVACSVRRQFGTTREPCTSCMQGERDGCPWTISLAYAPEVKETKRGGCGVHQHSEALRSAPDGVLRREDARGPRVGRRRLIHIYTCVAHTHQDT